MSETTPTAIHSDAAPAAVGPYSQAVAAGALVFVSGQLPLDTVSGEIVPGDAAAQAERSIANVREILAAAGTGLDAVVKTTVLLTDLADFAAVNAVYARHFSGPVLPARACYEVAGLPRGALVEIEAIAVR